MKSIHCFSLVSGNSRYNPKLSMSRHFHEFSKNNLFTGIPVNIPFIQILKQIVNVVLGLAAFGNIFVLGSDKPHVVLDVKQSMYNYIDQRSDNAI